MELFKTRLAQAIISKQKYTATLDDIVEYYQYYKLDKLIPLPVYYTINYEEIKSESKVIQKFINTIITENKRDYGHENRKRLIGLLASSLLKQLNKENVDVLKDEYKQIRKGYLFRKK